MHITGITTCVNYKHRLAIGATALSRGLDRWLVVTEPDDYDTIRYCAATGVPVLATSAFWRDGAAFNKAAAIGEAYRLLAPTEWVLFVDADVIPPTDWWELVDEAGCEPGNLYSVRRADAETLAPIRDGELAGYWHLFHATDPVVTGPKGLDLGSWHNASGYDSAFMLRWPPNRRLWIESFTVRHAGPRGTHWCGIGREDETARVHEERRRGRDWRTERYDRG